MVLNSYAILAAFVASLRLLLGVLVVGLGIAAWPGRAGGPEGRTALEDRSYLVFLVALLLVGLSLVSWPLLYVTLQSFVPEWSEAGVMCIYGVTQVGKRSLGPSRYLPGLLGLLQLSKPALVFAGGGWFVLYLLNRRTGNSALLGRLFVVLLPLGALALVDASAELAYLAIPKKEVWPPGGCCVVADGGPSRFLPTALLGAAGRPWLVLAYYGVNAALILGLFTAVYHLPGAPGTPALALLLLGGGAALATSALFLNEVAAPALLGLPHHHCPYDLVTDAPEGVVAVVLFLAGCLFLGWAGVARWLGRCGETEAHVAAAVRNLLRMSSWAYLASLAMLSLEVALT